jgi:hypothetical protein
VLTKYLAWAKKHQRMTNNVPEFAHIDELETDDARPATPVAELSAKTKKLATSRQKLNRQ